VQQCGRAWDVRQLQFVKSMADGKRELDRQMDVKARLKETEDLIEWVLRNPNMSDWLKDTLRNAMKRDPGDVLSELEIIHFLLRSRCECLLEISVNAINTVEPNDR